MGIRLLLLLTPVLICVRAAAAETIIEDSTGVLARLGSPVQAQVRLTKVEQQALEQRKLFALERGSGAVGAAMIPVQWVRESNGTQTLAWSMPVGQPGARRFEFVSRPEPADLAWRVQPSAGQFELHDGPRPVLRYNYLSVEPPAGFLAQITPGNRIYAGARSDYLHPLFGPSGEQLTRDWSPDHPHHRGIYWAWPEVDWRGQRGDLHALQLVFARPAGQIASTDGAVFGQIVASNLWRWSNGEPVVVEQAIIRGLRCRTGAWCIDLDLRFTALADPVALARRGTEHYGGLNLRMAAVTNQEITFHDHDRDPRRAWGELSGTFSGAAAPAGVVVIPHASNPDHPPQWVQYPELNWFQPTFPASGSRHVLQPGKALTLRYRLWIHPGPKASAPECAAHWEAYHHPAALAATGD